MKQKRGARNDTMIALRHQQRKTLARVAKDLHFSVSCSICMYENGERLPSAETQQLFANYYGVTVDYLFPDQISQWSITKLPHVLIQSREEKGFTQQELANQAWIPVQLLARIENGEELPTLLIAYCLAKALGKTIEELFFQFGEIDSK